MDPIHVFEYRAKLSDAGFRNQSPFSYAMHDSKLNSVPIPVLRNISTAISYTHTHTHFSPSSRPHNPKRIHPRPLRDDHQTLYPLKQFSRLRSCSSTCTGPSFTLGVRCPCEVEIRRDEVYPIFRRHVQPGRDDLRYSPTARSA